jgi:1-aminocyclopropane-1-carboxylate deaminase/D-cysteine desulfhydrase-like pyridoxal-dependent ACC family enzyme
MGVGYPGRHGGHRRLTREEIDLTFDFIPPGYGKSSREGHEALALVARTEGILLDPIYTAKAMAGLVSDVRRKTYSEGQNIVFVHTGGTPALFAYNEELATNIAPRKLS